MSNIKPFQSFNRTMLKGVLAFSLIAFPLCLLKAQEEHERSKEGYNTYYYPNGKLSSEGTIRNGKPDGYWKNYYENGKLKSEGNRVNYQLDSAWKFYTEKGLLYLIYDYKNGKKNGYKYVYTPNPKDSSKVILASKEDYVNDTLQGESEYYTNGKLSKIINYKDGLADGKSLEFSPDSLITSIIIYKGGFVKQITKINRYNLQGHKDGLWETFYPDDNVKWSGTYVDGKKDGYFKTFSPTGELLTVEKYIDDVLQLNPPELAKLDIKTMYYSNGQVASSGPYKGNEPIGIHRFYNEYGKATNEEVYDSGKVVATGPIDNADKQQGYWKEFYEDDDSVKSEGNYVNGTKVGLWKYYFDNGKPFETGKYDNNGKQTGKWMWYFDDGSLRRESNFTKGNEDGDFIEYNDSGKLITNGLYVDGMKEGKWVYEIGNYKSVGRYIDDLQDSVWAEYYIDNGKIRFIGKFNQGRPDGVHIWYYPDGTKKTEGEYNLGLKEGKWKYYNPDGTLYLTITFRDDVEVKYDNTEVK